MPRWPAKISTEHEEVAPVSESFRDLVDAFEATQDDEDPPSITDLMRAGIAQANRDSRHADSAALHLLSLRLGDLRPALAGARAVADGQLSDALAVLDALI